MWPLTVVVGAVFGKDTSQVPLAEDQDAVGEFGSGREYESFGEAVRSRASRWDLHGVDACTGQGSVERRELTGPVADEESDAGMRSSRSVRRLRACWVVHAPVGWLVVPRMCKWRLPTSGGRNTQILFGFTALSMW